MNSKLPDDGPAIAVVVVSDHPSTIAELVHHLRNQSIREHIELVVATPNPSAFDSGNGDVDSFANTTVVAVPAVTPLSSARAVAVRAAAAPFVFLGETHSFPAPTMLQELLAAHRSGWDRVGPVFVNANPSGSVSWAAFLLDYGVHAAPAPSGEMDVSVYNCSYRRSVLLHLGEALTWLLEAGSPLNSILRQAGCRSYREGGAEIAHTNVATVSSFVRERYLVGRNVGARVSRGWSRGRRALYVAGSPLIPFVLAYRTLRRGALRARLRAAPRLTLPVMLAGLVIRAGGEAVAYAIGAGSTANALEDIEIHKLEHTGKRP